MFFSQETESEPASRNAMQILDLVGKKGFTQCQNIFKGEESV